MPPALGATTGRGNTGDGAGFGVASTGPTTGFVAVGGAGRLTGVDVS